MRPTDRHSPPRSHTIADRSISSFRVLTLTVSDARKENLRAIAREVTSSGQGIFWFTCERAYQNNPAAVLNAIWQTARDDEYRQLI
jgi:hypothetical protein